MSNSQVEAGSKESIDQLHSLKYIYRRNGQGAPPHFHWSKREEYLNLGEGITTVAVYNKTDKNMIDYYSPIRIKINHVWAEISAGEPQRIPPGSSVYIPDRIIHSYSAEGNSTVAMEIASQHKVPLRILSTFDKGMGTLISYEDDPMNILGCYRG